MRSRYNALEWFLSLCVCPTLYVLMWCTRTHTCAQRSMKFGFWASERTAAQSPRERDGENERAGSRHLGSRVPRQESRGRQDRGTRRVSLFSLIEHNDDDSVWVGLFFLFFFFTPHTTMVMHASFLKLFLVHVHFLILFFLHKIIARKFIRTIILCKECFLIGNIKFIHNFLHAKLSKLKDWKKKKRIISCRKFRYKNSCVYRK